MKRIPPVVTYTVLRLLAFAVPLALLLFLGFEPWVATVLAAIIGLSLSYIFLRQPREQVAAELYDRRHGNRTPVTADEDAEDTAHAEDTVDTAHTEHTVDEQNTGEFRSPTER
ncbi:DUF4229 domain-containing protein [Mycetocola zhujimingii]|uniref:DUF4229 domain-containing protein n=1 Tax=Mycetocola zhujimingii TaxID=2079792 RepID=A0A2U1TA94_9MICO|nr:DUF4229 domain-containing protein [Mycetocola zhujimingii]PWC04615.1 DUF4229 domain-containing protein [Mycetocola zhujimingii]